MHLTGIHHVTAVTADVQANLDFYTGVLGLRLTKVTVNFDDPHSYHLYYGDSLGRPGTAMTFFGWPGAKRGRHGPAEVFTTAFAVPAGSLDYWRTRLGEHGIVVLPDDAGDASRDPFILVEDPDGLRLSLVATNDFDRAIDPYDAVVPRAHAIRGFHEIALAVLRRTASEKALTDVFGFALIKDAHADVEGDGHYVSRSPVQGEPVARVRLLSDLPAGKFGAGVVHHVAFRTPDDRQHEAWRDKIIAAGLHVSPVMERVYFRSIYVREPGGVLFEVATDSPGFTADEPAESLGTRLCLPPWMEKNRAAIESGLPKLRLPGGNTLGGA